MKKMTDQQADALRDQGKIVFKSSSSEAIGLAAMWSFFMLCIVSFGAYMEKASTWQEYAYFFLLFLLGSSFSVFILVINKRAYTVLDKKGVTQQFLFNHKRLFWGEVKFVGTYSDRGTSSILVSPMPLPEGEECVGANRRISDSALFKLRSSRMISIPNTSFTENRLAIVIEMWEKYRDTAEAAVGDYRYFPRQPRQ